MEDSSDPSDPCSCDSKFSDVTAESESTVCAQDTGSTSTDCRCKDEQVRSDQSMGSTFVICDKVEDPCSSKMSSVSDSEDWSSKSCSGAETVLCDQAHRDFDQTAGLKSNYGDYYSRSLKRDRDSGREACKVRKEDACKCQGGFRSKRRISKTREPWSTCSCIAEEDEGDVCVTEESPKLTVCQNSVDSDLQRDSEDKRKSMEGVGENVDEQIEGKQEDGLDRRQSSLTSRKLRRPEALTLKQLIQHGRRPAGGQTITIPPSEGINDTEPPVEQAREKQEPAFLKKFNLRDKDRFLKHLKDFQASDEPEQNRKSGGGEETEEKKKGEKEEDEDDNEGKKGFPGRLRNSFFKTLRRVSGREKDKIAEKDSDNRTEASEKITDEQLVKDEGTQKGKRMSLTERLDINKFFKKKDKSADKKKPPSKMKGKRSAETDSEIKSNTDEGTEKKKDEEKKEAFEVPEEPDKQLPLSADVASKNPVPKPANIEETNETVPEDLPESLAPQDTVKINTRDIQEESKDQKEPGDQEEKRPDAKNVEESRKIEEIREEKNTKVCPGLKKVSVTVCTRRPQEKPSTKELRQPACRSVSQEPEVRTVCTNQQFPARTNADRSNERIEDSRCNCCCVPAPQSCSRLSNYPKSCLKKERPFYRMESQENNCSVLYRDNRSWEECGCRRIILCEWCCSPRNECSCRPVPSCVTCYKPKTECICNTVCPPRSSCRRPKSMVCLYCDSPRESCTCRAPIRKCSCCDLAVDLCCCEENLKSVQGGRPVATEPECERTIYVTAWKPREDVRRYFSRNLDDLRHDSINECCCHEKPKSQNSDDLPYQRLSCFSDVMNELQRKISESVCCTQCRKIPCCCNLKVDEGRDEKKIKYCVSPKSRRKVVAVCTDKPRSKSPTICKCDPQSRTERSKKIVICCICKSSPCRCKKSKSKKPRMKCYYCKNSPCVCITARERSSKPRPCRCADSPCRGKEKEITVCGKTSAKPKNNEEKIICVR
ncbi:uncharacterized protein LOC143356465 [Halictus rubicundus]|uniref:uncharacterized protein LOC143356465 n=1 Tax=Halictus rubicundus TaxID=77578 RepID=UPI0040357C5F